ncbi:hypothetical protein Leryth_007769 [Lithospermum erythrorhizon]|nr:hypothetical protein Leryth_007769 [Lithospermum erythrorhizon]
MATNTLSTFSLYKPNSTPPFFPPNSSTKPPLQIHNLHTQTPTHKICNYSKNNSTLTPISKRSFSRIQAVVEEEAVAVEGESVSGDTSASTVSVQVSPSDVLTMLFKAEGTMNEAVIPAIYQALEGVEGVSDLKVQVVEGIASVELTKQTTHFSSPYPPTLLSIIFWQAIVILTWPESICLLWPQHQSSIIILVRLFSNNWNSKKFCTLHLLFYAGIFVTRSLLTKQTTVQATGVASGLVEIIQGSGFKLQTLTLSFQDEDDMK